MTSGATERLRWGMPMAAALAAVVFVMAGLWRTAFAGPPDGFIMWLFTGPLLAVIACTSLVAAVRGRWGTRWLVVTALGLAAVLSLSSATWMFSLPDEEQPPLRLFWAAVIAFVILMGVAVSIALAPRLRRQFNSPVSLLLGFGCGIAGAPFITFIVVPGIGIAVIGIAVTVLTLRLRRRVNGRPTPTIT